MKKLILILTMMCIYTHAEAAVIWNGPNVTFTKADYADWNLEANQDRITDDVWITRKDNKGIWNIKAVFAGEPGYLPFESPIGTEWATGSLSDYDVLSYTDWQSWHGSFPPGVVGTDAVMHIIPGDIYLSIRMDSWTEGDMGGGFSYTRSSPIPVPPGIWLLGSGLVSLIWLRRKA